jgi:hypothetical protein
MFGGEWNEVYHAETTLKKGTLPNVLGQEFSPNHLRKGNWSFSDGFHIPFSEGAPT